MRKNSDIGCVNLAEKQEMFVKIQSAKRKKLLDRLKHVQRQIEKTESRMNIGGDPGLFEKNLGRLALTHERDKDYISMIRCEVRSL